MTATTVWGEEERARLVRQFAKRLIRGDIEYGLAVGEAALDYVREAERERFLAEAWRKVSDNQSVGMGILADALKGIARDGAKADRERAGRALRAAGIPFEVN